MNPIKLALKNITKLNKFIFIFVNLCPWLLGCGGGSPESTILKPDDNIGDPNAYQAFLEFARGQKDENGLHLFFFDVGHGNFILVRDKYDAIVVDAGGNKTADIMAYIKNLFETCLGNATLRQIIITHDHEDHTNYVNDVKEWAKAYEQGELSSVQNLFHSSRVISKQYELKLVQIKTIKGHEDIESVFDEFPVRLSFLQPLHEITTENENDKSSVFVLTYQGIKVLFTGDATGLSLDNYVEKHQGFSEQQNGIVDQNRWFLKDIHLFVMPHHGSFTEDSFRWALYVAKHSPNLLASVVCGDPFVEKYQDVKTGIRDFPWPMSMRNNTIKNNFIYYWSIDPSKIGKKNEQGKLVNKYDFHKKKTNAALFITGTEPCRCVYFKIQDSQLHKYDSSQKGFICLDGKNVGINEDDNNEIMGSITVPNNETNAGPMMQTSNIPMNGGGFGMNGSTQKMEKMEEVEISGIGQFTEQNETKEDESDSNTMSEDDNGISSTLPSNVYKIQDAFDDDNDYMAYAS